MVLFFTITYQVLPSLNGSKNIAIGILCVILYLRLWRLHSQINLLDHIKLIFFINSNFINRSHDLLSLSLLQLRFEYLRLLLVLLVLNVFLISILVALQFLCLFNVKILFWFTWSNCWLIELCWSCTENTIKVFWLNLCFFGITFLLWNIVLTDVIKQVSGKWCFMTDLSRKLHWQIIDWILIIVRFINMWNGRSYSI